MTARIVVLGGGTGGTIAANRLRRALDERSASITVVDRDDIHVYQPGLLLVPFGLADPSRLTKPRRRQLRAGVGWHQASVDRVRIEDKQVDLDDGAVLDYDVLIVASGAALQPEETEGLTGPGWLEKVFTFYDLEGALALRDAFERFGSGRLVVNVVDMPIRCPVAPLEFSFLADWILRKRGRRSDVELTFATPLDAAFTNPIAARALGGLLAEKGVRLITEFNTGTVNGTAGTLTAYDGRELEFDLAVVVPLHGGAPFVAASPGLGDGLGFIEVDPATLQSRAREEIFALGDAAGIPTSKAGSVAHFEGEVIVENVLRHLAGEPLDARFDGHTNCFIESGFHKALLIDFNYETEPLPGHFPGRLGLPLLREARVNHLGKLAFERLYWHGLLPGRNLPGISGPMPRSGKLRPPAA